MLKVRQASRQRCFFLTPTAFARRRLSRSRTKNKLSSFPTIFLPAFFLLRFPDGGSGYSTDDVSTTTTITGPGEEDSRISHRHPIPTSACTLAHPHLQLAW